MNKMPVDTNKKLILAPLIISLEIFIKFNSKKILEYFSSNAFAEIIVKYFVIKFFPF